MVFKHGNYFCYYLINIIILQPKFLQKQKKPKLFWVSAIAPMVVVVVGCLFAYLIRGKDYGIQIVSALSSMSFNFIGSFPLFFFIRRMCTNSHDHFSNLCDF